MLYSIKNGKIFTKQIEISITTRCCLSCRGCNHLTPICKREDIDLEMLKKSLEKLEPHFHADEIHLLGGEPLLCENLPEIIKIVRDSKVSDKIYILSNGILAPGMNPDILNTIDKLRISVHTKDLNVEKIRSMALGRCDLEMYFFHSFCEPYSEPGTDDKELVRDIFNTCKSVHVYGCYVLEKGKFYKCGMGCWLNVFKGMNPRDCVDIFSSTDVFNDIKEYLDNSEPLSVCKYCLGNVGSQFVQTQVPRSDWRSYQDLPTEKLINKNYLNELKIELTAGDNLHYNVIKQSKDS